MDNVFEQVEKNIDNLVLGNADWTASATKEELEAARKGELHLRFWNGEVPAEWLRDIKGKRVLCLAGAGGLQAPLFACAGAKVTVIDLSGGMLEKDRAIAEREKLGKKPIEEDDDDDSTSSGGTTERTVSTTDPESGMFVKGEHERQFAYEAHTACDRKGFVLGVEVTAGNVHVDCKENTG